MVFPGARRSVLRAHSRMNRITLVRVLGTWVKMGVELLQILGVVKAYRASWATQGVGVGAVEPGAPPNNKDWVEPRTAKHRKRTH